MFAFLGDQLLAYFSVLYMYTLGVLNTDYSLVSLSHVKSHYEVKTVSWKSPLGITNINIQIDLIFTVCYQYVYCAISVHSTTIQFFKLYILDFFLSFFLFLIFIYYLFIMFIFGCVGSSFLWEGFLQLRRVGATLHRGARACHYRGLSCCRAEAPDAQAQ